MLVITRRPGTEVVIAGCIRVTVLKVGGGRVRLGISAPSDVPVRRGELADTAGPRGPDTEAPPKSVDRGGP